MATEEKDKKDGNDAPKKSKKKLIIIIAVVVVLLGGGAGAFFALKGSKKPADGEEGGSGDASTDEGGGKAGEGGDKGELPGAIIPLDPFIVNLQVKGSFLKTTIQLEFGEPTQPHTFESDLPKVRDAVIRILSSKGAADILSAEGKEKLRDEIKGAVNNALGSEDVVNVYFTEFIVQ